MQVRRPKCDPERSSQSTVGSQQNSHSLPHPSTWQVHLLHQLSLLFWPVNCEFPLTDHLISLYQLISQIHVSPTRYTILLNIFISLLHKFRAFTCPSSGENYYIYATMVFVTLYGWRLVCWLDSNK